MSQKSPIWTRQGYIGAKILHSNIRSGNYKLIFAGSEPLEGEQWKIHFILSYSSYNSTHQNIAYSSNFYIPAKPGQHIRFEPYLGITEDANIEYRPRDLVRYQHFYPVQFIKPIRIEIDSLYYEVHCI
ncbi:hypothetical protein HNQ80_000548 [Anaerosolibacter carboniphilus]|uniref:Uncharacterized protein n=1 Tax=Anaerosolibacter carboniphilus TaxID=1417629 RepID=A0A841KQR7_9FIRM|nr:hypothetical protein [Anaerosolibacter carboniphilus]MBB6214468.1 hypothetical protein [Anaerosolibacter carboniphilus]